MDMLKQSVQLRRKEFAGDKSEWVAAKASDDKAALKWMRKVMACSLAMRLSSFVNLAMLILQVQV